MNNTGIQAGMEGARVSDMNAECEQPGMGRQITIDRTPTEPGSSAVTGGTPLCWTRTPNRSPIIEKSKGKVFLSPLRWLIRHGSLIYWLLVTLCYSAMVFYLVWNW